MNPASSLFRIALLILFAHLFIGAAAAKPDPQPAEKGRIYSVGVAKIDITPDYPVLMNGYYYRTNESTGVLQPIFAKALAIGTDAEGPAILISADNCGLPTQVRETLLKRLEKKGITSDKLAICVSHSHSAPKLAGNLDNIFGRDIPPEHQAHIDRYTGEFINNLEKVALAALKNRKPARLSWGKTSASFAMNRRVSNGPVDHDLPVLKVTSESGENIAVLVNYACHCTTLHADNMKISGDWAGHAQEELERVFPGAIAMTVIGCGAECNPSSMLNTNAEAKLRFASEYGRTIAETARKLEAMTPLSEKLECRSKRIQLPLETLPTRQELETLVKVNEQSNGLPQVAYLARKNLARLDRGETLPTEVPYILQTWNFGKELALVFLSGEVVGDYSLRLKQEFDPERLWITAYANTVPCYIPSRRVWKQHGYETETSMVYYDWPTRLAESTEDTVIGAVHQIMPLGFAAAPREKSTAEKEKLHIYLLLGQSNMVGRGAIEGQDRAAHARVLLFTPSNHWELAVEPLHGSGPRAGIGPGLVFGKIVAAKNTNANIGLVPCAVGATLLKRWEKGGDLYSNAVARARAAMCDGTLKGIVWHQGEQDSILEVDANSYHERLIKMIGDIRSDLGEPNLPFVVGQIGEFLYTRKKQQTPFAKTVNDALARIPQDVPSTACVHSTGLTHVGDEVHFDGKSQRELGKRYAIEMLKLQGAKQTK
jgi:Carbohydrate esterase, sialic acid-specific acetylesterase/Neutral/alkaline non-lysosomal ceramidase, N-terminal